MERTCFLVADQINRDWIPSSFIVQTAMTSTRLPARSTRMSMVSGLRLNRTTRISANCCIYLQARFSEPPSRRCSSRPTLNSSLYHSSGASNHRHPPLTLPTTDTQTSTLPTSTPRVTCRSTRTLTAEHGLPWARYTNRGSTASRSLNGRAVDRVWVG